MNDDYSIIYSPEAKDDLREIYSYITFSLKVPETAERIINLIRKEIRSLNFMPSRYGIVDWEPWRSMNMHKFPINNFVVYYTADNNLCKVTIIRIFYNGRNVEGIINTEPITQADIT